MTKKNMWTQFMDMHSGGGLKEEPYGYIYIEAPEKEAKTIFYNRFGHNPERVTCTCCGNDYSINEKESLAQLTGFERNCRSLETPRGKNGLYKNNDPVIVAHLYLEENEQPPEGYKLSNYPRFSKYQTLDQYLCNKDVLIIYTKDIKPNERMGEVPEQGYVWKD